MRRLFVPSVVLLVLSVVMMVGSWFKLWFELPGRVLGVSLSYGQVLIHLPGDPNGFATSGGYVNVNVAWPLVPQYNSNFFGGWYIIVPCWYFVVLCARRDVLAPLAPSSPHKSAQLVRHLRLRPPRRLHPLPRMRQVHQHARGKPMITLRPGRQCRIPDAELRTHRAFQGVSTPLLARRPPLQRWFLAAQRRVSSLFMHQPVSTGFRVHRLQPPPTTRSPVSLLSPLSPPTRSHPPQ
jgi:hypothetical protein